jgi:hypothetical protein
MDPQGDAFLLWAREERRVLAEISVRSSKILSQMPMQDIDAASRMG